MTTSSLLRGFAWICAIFGAIVFLLHLFVFDTWVIPEGEMLAASVEPNLRAGDRVLVRRGSIPGHGQLARCSSPSSRSGYVMGRVFGSTGNEILVRGENVFLDGKVLPAQKSCLPMTFTDPKTGRGLELSCAVFDTGVSGYGVLSRRSTVDTAAPVTIEEGTLYLVSDNRYLHQDSRDFGLVDAAACEHVVFRLWGASLGDRVRRFGLLW